MKSIPAALLATLVAASLGAQPADYSAVPLDTPPPDGQQAPPVPDRTDGTLSFYGDRGSFQAANPGLPLEDFADNNVGPAALGTCTDVPIDSTTNDACFSPGDILPGIAFSSSIPAEDMVLLTVGFPPFPVVCNALGPNTFTDDSRIDFDPPLRAVGFDVQCNAPDTLTLEILGPGGSLGTMNVACSVVPAQTFFGVDTVDPGGISAIATTSPQGAGELYCDIEFGGMPVPVELQSIDVD